MANQIEWKCQKCGKVGEFKMIGNGFIICTGCGAWHVVTASGKIHRVGKATPELVWVKPPLDSEDTPR